MRSRVGGTSGRTAVLLLACALGAAALSAPAGPAVAAGPDRPAPAPRAVAAQAAALRTAGPAPALRAPAAESGSVVRRVKLEWKGAPGPKATTREVPIPGIGTLSLTCRVKETRVTLTPTDPTAETQLWMAKYEDKSYGRAVAVKTVRIYRYQHWYDRSGSGTGRSGSEGLNQRRGKHGVENFGKGYAHGVISQRPARNERVGDAALPPITTFNLNWYWNGFDYPARYRYCKFDAVFVTTLGRHVGVEWHTESDAVGRDDVEFELPGTGRLQVRCETGRLGRRSLSFLPDDEDSTAYIETIEGEGRVEDHVEIRDQRTDPDNLRLGPIVLPRNGLLRIFVKHDGTQTPYLVSSYIKTNDSNPAQNLCEVALGRFPA
ncbi:hypothetical protein [Nocardioides sp.]|uniref:hypothetical protein n=1 Tax=Nocardioides sp. TaxID=35761 RepID=UPI0035189945